MKLLEPEQMRKSCSKNLGQLFRERAEAAGRREPLLCIAWKRLHRELEAQGVAFRRAAALRDERERTTPAGVARALAGIVLRDARVDIPRDPTIERAVAATDEVDEPRIPNDATHPERA